MGDKKEEGKAWSAQGYLGLQQWDHSLYSMFNIAIAALVIRSAVGSPMASGSAQLGAVLVSHGPVVAAMVLWYLYDKMSWRWPFQKEPFVGGFGFFLLAGWLACLVPVY